MIKKSIKTIIVCGLTFMVFAPVLLVAQGITVQGGSDKKWTHDGVEYTTTFIGKELMTGPDHRLSGAKMSGIGEIIFSEGDKILKVTSDVISALGDNMITVNVNSADQVFQLDSHTVICKEDTSISSSSLNVGEVVVVTSTPDGKDVGSVKVGPLIVTGLMSMTGNLTPVDYHCGSLSPVAWWEFWK